MITTFLLTIVLAFVNFVIGVLPVGNLPTGFTTALAYFTGVANSFSYFIPVDTLLQAAAVVLIFDGALIVWYFINWIIRKIPGMQ